MDFDHTFRSKKMFRPVDVRLEMRAFFFKLTLSRKRIYLITAAIGEDGFIPAIKFMKAAGTSDNI